MPIHNRIAALFFACLFFTTPLQADGIFNPGSSGEGGGAVSSVSGTAGQVTCTPSTGNVVCSLPSTITENLIFSGTLAFSGLSAGTQVSCLGLDSGNNLVLNAAACGSGGGGAVSSVFGRTGAVVAASNDYSFSQISGNYTLAQGPTIGANTVLGSIAGGTPAALTQTQLTSLVNVASAGLSGAVPAWPNDATKFFNGQGNYITAVTSIATGCGTTSSPAGPITTTGSIFSQATVRANTATTDTVASGDCGNFLTESNASSIAVTLPQATGSFATGFYYKHINQGVGLVTITPTTSTINGLSNITLATGQSADIAAQSGNYIAAINGPGTVISASVTTANGVSASVATATSTPAFTFTLGAITPSSVAIGAGSAITSSGPGGVLGSNAFNSTAYLPLAGGTLSGELVTLASATGTAGFNLPHGAAPTSPVNGDLWTTTSGLFARINGSTVGPYGTGGSGITALTGDVTASGTGSVAATVAAIAGVAVGTPTGTGNVVFSASPTLTGTLTAAAANFSSAVSVASSSASALAVGLNGATNPSFSVDDSTALQAAGLNIKGAVTGGTVALAAIDSGAATNLTINAKGTGTIGIGSVSTGAVTITPATTLSAALTYGGVTLSNSVSGTGSMALTAGTTFTGTTTVATLSASAAVNTVTFTSSIASSAAAVLGAIRNTSANSAAAGVFNFGNNSSNTEVVATLNSSANTAGNGTSSFTINNIEATNTGGIFFQTQGTNALTISKAQAIGIPGIASSSAAQTGTLCWTTGTGNITVDTTVGCLTSLREAKDIHRRPSTQEALDITTKLSLIDFNYRKGWQDNGQYEQYGLVADEVAAVDERLVGRDPSGKLQGVRYMELSAVNSAAIARLQEEIESLKRSVH